MIERQQKLFNGKRCDNLSLNGAGKIDGPKNKWFSEKKLVLEKKLSMKTLMEDFNPVVLQKSEFENWLITNDERTPSSF